MNPLKVQNVPDKIRAHSITAENLPTLPVTDNEVQLNTNVDEERVSESLKINKLKPGCLAQVLTHLPVLDRLEMEKVCQKWKEAIEMSSFNFKKINFNDLKITLNEKEETWKIILMRYGHYLTHLTITAKDSLICNIIKNNCQNIIYFDVHKDANNKKVSYKSLLQMVASMPKLKYLKVTIHRYNYRNFFTQLIRELPNDMEEIHLITSGRIDLNISVVPDKFKSLGRLTLQGFNLDESIMAMILLNNNTLVHLDLTRCDLPPDTSVFSNLHNLEYLNLNWIRNLSVDIISAIARNCPKLNHFKWCCLNDNYNIQAVPYRNFNELKYLKNLEYLCLEGIERSNDDEGFLSNIANNCKKLKHLNIDYRYSLSVSDVKEITKLKNLEYLHLRDAEIDSKSLIQIANNCRELRVLFIWFIDHDKSAIEKLPNLKKLEQFIFFECDNLTGDVLIKIASACTNLKDIMIRYCDNVTEASLIQVAKLQFLERLVIDNNTVNVPIAMFDYLHNLKELSCRDCPSVTDEGIIKVIDNCQNLSRLSLEGTSVTVETLIHALNRRFIFQILHISISKSDEINRYYKNAIKSPYLDLKFIK